MSPQPKVNTKKVRIAESVLARWDSGDAIAVIARDEECGTNTVRRIVDQQRPGERLARQIVVERDTKVCTECGKDLVLDQFPPRPDREGKLHAKCYACLRDWFSSWQRANPDRNREGSRRRARMRKSRTHHYRDSDIYERDGGLCLFCHDSIDLSLSHPDPFALSIHHIHPISKMGPDVPSNVACAHFVCNHQAKDRYESPFIGWYVAPIPRVEAREIMAECHYLHRRPLTSFAFGLFDASGELTGAITFGSPSSNRIVKSVTASDVRVLELNRLWIKDGAPHGSGSFFITRAVKQLPAAIVISYADLGVTDPRYDTVHTGSVYRACSWNYGGTSAPAQEWRIPGEYRNVGRGVEGSVLSEVTPKSRYWTLSGTRTDRKSLLHTIRWVSLPYPKIAAEPC